MATRWLRRLVPVVFAVTGCVTRPTPMMDDQAFAQARERMVEDDLRGRDIRDERVLNAMRTVPRHRFVPPAHAADAYADHPLPIGGGQTISQPYVVALMTQQLGLRGGEKILEIGTGSGYQAAVLAEMGCAVYSIEIAPDLAVAAQRRLAELGYHRVHVRAGDGYFGWKEAAPFDAAIITAATPQIPPPVAEQLREGGIIILPLGTDDYQTLTRGIKGPQGIQLKSVGGVSFVPMTGTVRTPGAK